MLQQKNCYYTSLFLFLKRTKVVYEILYFTHIWRKLTRKTQWRKGVRLYRCLYVSSKDNDEDDGRRF